MFEQAFNNVDDVLWKKAGCTTELDYTEQTSWVLFLKYLDDLEKDKALEAQLTDKPYRNIIEEPYRWEDWATPLGMSGTFDRTAILNMFQLSAEKP
jgi:type I restriction enzyme M protein